MGKQERQQQRPRVQGHCRQELTRCESMFQLERWEWDCKRVPEQKQEQERTLGSEQQQELEGRRVPEQEQELEQCLYGRHYPRLLSLPSRRPPPLTQTPSCHTRACIGFATCCASAAVAATSAAAAAVPASNRALGRPDLPGAPTVFRIHPVAEACSHSRGPSGASPSYPLSLTSSLLR